MNKNDSDFITIIFIHLLFIILGEINYVYHQRKNIKNPIKYNNYLTNISFIYSFIVLSSG